MPMVNAIVKLLKPELKPDYVEKIKKIMERNDMVEYNSIDELRRKLYK
jgi:hypothetical protein